MCPTGSHAAGLPLGDVLLQLAKTTVSGKRTRKERDWPGWGWPPRRWPASWSRVAWSSPLRPSRPWWWHCWWSRTEMAVSSSPPGAYLSFQVLPCLSFLVVRHLRVLFLLLFPVFFHVGRHLLLRRRRVHHVEIPKSSLTKISGDLRDNCELLGTFGDGQVEFREVALIPDAPVHLKKANSCPKQDPRIGPASTTPSRRASSGLD